MGRAGPGEVGPPNVLDERVQGHPAERGEAGQQGVEGRAEAEDVGGRAESLDLAGRLLGAHERGGPHHRAGHRRRGVAARERAERLRVGRPDRVGPVEGLGQAPVDDEGLAVGAKHDVVRLEIAVEDAPAVGVVDRLADRDKPGDELAELQRMVGVLLGLWIGVDPLDRGFEGIAPDEPHRVIRLAVGVAAEAVDRDDPRVFQPSGDLGLEDEAELAVSLVEVLLLDLLEGDLAVKLGVECEIDFAESPLGVEPERVVTRGRMAARGGRGPAKPAGARHRPARVLAVVEAGRVRVFRRRPERAAEGCGERGGVGVDLGRLQRVGRRGGVPGRDRLGRGLVVEAGPRKRGLVAQLGRREALVRSWSARVGHGGDSLGAFGRVPMPGARPSGLPC